MGKGDGAFAGLLTTAREQQGLSQYALAKLTGLSKQAISQLEMGRYEPSWGTVQLIAAALGADCTAFADPGMRLPTAESAKPRGRPRKPAKGKKGKGK